MTHFPPKMHSVMRNKKVFTHFCIDSGPWILYKQNLKFKTGFWFHFIGCSLHFLPTVLCVLFDSKLFNVRLLQKFWPPHFLNFFTLLNKHLEHTQNSIGQICCLRVPHKPEKTGSFTECKIGLFDFANIICEI